MRNNESYWSGLTEPSLQPVTGERFDIVVQSFWRRDRQRAFFDVRVSTRTHLAIKTPQSLSAIGRTSWKRRENTRNVCAKLNMALSPRWCSQLLEAYGYRCYHCLQETGLPPSREAIRKTIQQNATPVKLRCRLNFSLLRSAIMCLRGSRSIFSPVSTSQSAETIDLALHEGQVPSF